MKHPTKLFEPITIGTMKLKNRIVLEGFTLINEETNAVGYINHKYIDFFEERAKGGVGLIITGDVMVEHKLCVQDHLCLEDDEFSPGLSALTEAVHAWGAKIAPDLVHFGYRTDKKWCPMLKGEPDYRPLSPSPMEYEGTMAKEMNAEEIEDLQEKFAVAAERAMKVGFDAVQLSGGFGFLIHQFLSPRYNKRTDKYGGSLDNRMRFTLEIIERIKSKIGDDLPLIFRLSADEFVEGGLTVDDSLEIARRLEAGGIDILNVTAGIDLPDKHHLNIFPMGTRQGPLIDLGARVKDAVSIPTIIVGRITSPLFAEKVVKDGKADLIGIARQIACDPEWPIKTQQGRYLDIMPCIGCNVCLQRIFQRQVSRCSVNAAMGREREFSDVRAQTPRKVLVIGGGPGGMEAARRASFGGHDVILCEKQNRLGGQLCQASKAPYCHELRQLILYLSHQIGKSGIDLRLGTEVTRKMIDELAPDVVILATGSVPFYPDIPGVGKDHVATAWDILDGRQTGRRVAVIGGGLIGCTVAEYLVAAGKTVTIIDQGDAIGLDMEMSNRSALRERFEGYDITIVTNAVIREIHDTYITVERENQQNTIDCDSVVIAIKSVAKDSLLDNLRREPGDKEWQVYAIGDCLKPGRIVDAINQAAYIINKI